jgi:hypothetical protein
LDESNPGRKENREGSKDPKEDTKRIGGKEAQKPQKNRSSFLRFLRLFAANPCFLEHLRKL